MDYEFIFEKGKHKGKTVAWVSDNDPSYLVWVEECKPELLLPNPKKRKTVDIDYSKDNIRKYTEPTLDEKESAIKPNLNFWNEGKKENKTKK
jgi:hypothetical protein